MSALKSHLILAIPILLMISIPNFSADEILDRDGIQTSSIDLEATRSSEYFNSPTGGKWVYDFSSEDPLSVFKNLSITDGMAVLKERFELDDLSTGTVGSLPPNWVESDPSEGDLVLDDTVYGDSPNSAHYSTVNGGQGYSVSRIMPTVGSSDTLEVRFSIRVEDISETTSDQGISCRVHYTGQDDGPEIRFHSNNSISYFGWDGSGNVDRFPGRTYIYSNWYIITYRIDMQLQKYGLWVGTEKITPDGGAPFRSSSGSNILFMNTLSFITGSGNDGGEFYVDDIFSTKNTIDEGSYTSPTISKTALMEWQYLQVYPAVDETLLTLSLLNVSSGRPFSGFDSITIPANGRIGISGLPGSVQNFRIFVHFRREGTRRPALDLVGASWKLKGHFFDPLFPGTGLQRSSLDHVKEGMELSTLSETTYTVSGYVVSPLITLTPGRVWGTLSVDHLVPDDASVSIDVLGSSGDDPLPDIPTDHDGTIDLFELGLPLGQEIRIRVSLTGNGTNTPIVRWISIEEPENTDPYLIDANLDKEEVYRMSNVTFTVSFDDDTDHPDDLTIGAEYSFDGSDWSSDLVSEQKRNGTEAVMIVEIPSGSNIGDLSIIGYAVDRTGAKTYSDILTVLVKNRKVTRPMIDIDPESPFTDNILKVRITGDSIDPEGDVVRYRYHWFINGEIIDPSDPNGPDINYTPMNTTSKESTLSPSFTKKGDNVSCMVVATDMIEDGPETWVYAMIENSPPYAPATTISLVQEEDTPVTIDLESNFTDVDMDELEFSWDEKSYLDIQLTENATLKITPQKDLTGEVSFNITASDGTASVNISVFITYTPINDDPFIEPMADSEIEQGDSINVQIIWGDAESGPDTVLEVTLPSTWGEDGVCTFDEYNSTIHIEAENGNVGNHTFKIFVMDREGNEFSTSFNITVLNRDDPMEDASIISPEDGSEFKTGENITFIAEVMDPDVIHGQEFNYKWFLVTEQIGSGNGITFSFDEVGSYTITLEVSDGLTSITRKVKVNITQVDGSGGGGGGSQQEEEESSINPLLMAVSAAAILLFIAFLLTLLMLKGKKKSEGENEEQAEDLPETASEPEGPEVQEQTSQEPIVQEPPIETAPPEAVPAPEEPIQEEPDILIPSSDDILMPADGSPDIDIPDVQVPDPEIGLKEEDEESMEYYSPSRK